MWVKICGITNLEDALCAVESGADALGFVFYPHSPRYITPSKALDIVQKLPLHVEKIALFVNSTPMEINLTCKEAQMDRAQIHFDVDSTFFQALEGDYLPVVRAQTAKDVSRYHGSLRLVDAYVQSFGGAGQRVDLSWFEQSDNDSIILAGGLNSENIEEVKRLGFYGVDVSSGVEQRKGVKDHAKLKAFLQKAKA